MLQIILKYHHKAARQAQLEENLVDRYFLKTLEEILLKERHETLLASLDQVETLLGEGPDFWCDQLNALKYLKPHCLATVRCGRAILDGLGTSTLSQPSWQNSGSLDQ